MAQVYLTDPSSAGEPPVQLKSFQRVNLAPGQTRRLHFTLDQRAFSIWNSDAQDWTTVDGTYRVHAGDSSASLPLSAPVLVPRTAGVQYVSVQAPQVITPGTAATFTDTGDFAVRHVDVSLRAPHGWTVTPRHDQGTPEVRAHSHATRTWTD